MSRTGGGGGGGAVYEDQSTVVFSDPNWIASQPEGSRFIHRNNVLYYFMASPFFDPSSRNQEVFTACTANPSRWAVLGQYQDFEAEMALRPGVEYVLAHDPEGSNTMIEGGPGPDAGQMVRSTLFVIRKQRRVEAGPRGRTVPMGFYWCLGTRIFQAPSVSNVLNARVLGVAVGLQKVFAKTAGMGVFSAREGRQWVKRKGDAISDKTGSATGVGGGEEGTEGKEETPVPPPTQESTDIRSRGTLDKAGENRMAVGVADEDEQDSRTLQQALRMTMQYGKEYADEMSLVGEPGSFRFSKVKDNAAGTSVGSLAVPSQSQVGSSRSGTPALQSRSVSVSMAAR